MVAMRPAPSRHSAGGALVTSVPGRAGSAASPVSATPQAILRFWRLTEASQESRESWIVDEGLEQRIVAYPDDTRVVPETRLLQPVQSSLAIAEEGNGLGCLELASRSVAQLVGQRGVCASGIANDVIPKREAECPPTGAFQRFGLEGCAGPDSILQHDDRAAELIVEPGELRVERDCLTQFRRGFRRASCVG
jgi:hypothetical protein